MKTSTRAILAVVFLVATAGAGSCATVSCTGNGVQPPLEEVTPLHLDFGNVLVGQSKALDLLICNAGQGILTGKVYRTPLCSSWYTIANPGEAPADTLFYSLAAGGSKLVKVAFAPLNAAQGATCDIEVRSEVVVIP